MKKRVVLRAVGEVQKVGYRDFVQKIARKLGVVGHVENRRDGSVQMVCEAEESVIQEFQKAINVKVDFIDVTDVKIIETGKPTGEFEFFDIKYGCAEEELGERMGAGILYMAATRDEVKASRQDLQAMHNDLKDGFKGTKDGLTEVKNEVNSMHTDVNTRFDTLDTKYGEIGVKMSTLEHDIGDLTRQITRLVDHIVGEEKKGSQ